MGKLGSFGGGVGGGGQLIGRAPKVADSFYSSTEWRSLMRDIYARRGRWCEDCGAGGRGVRLYGDHIKEIRDGGAKLDPMNVRIRCAKCHGRKTAIERARRV